MSQGLRMLLAAAATLVLLPVARSADPETQITCQVWVVRVSDECFDRMRMMSCCDGGCCQACPACPHKPCEAGSCCDQKGCSESSCGKSCCEEKHCTESSCGKSCCEQKCCE